MKTKLVSRFRFFSAVTFLVSLLVAGCSVVDPIHSCLPVILAENLQTETVEFLWQREISDNLRIRVVLAKDQAGNLSPTMIVSDKGNQRIAVLTLELIDSTPVYIVWINDEIQQVSSSSGPYTTIHAIGYIPPDLYPDKTMFTADFTFQSKEHKTEVDNEFFYRESAFQKGVIWFPIADFDFEKYKYLLRIDIDTEESLSTNSAVAGDPIYREWSKEFQPAIDIAGYVVNWSQLAWISYTENTECVVLE